MIQLKAGRPAERNMSGRSSHPGTPTWIRRQQGAVHTSIGGSRRTHGEPFVPGPLGPDQLRDIDAYWRAANYLSVGQIYLMDNPLLREALKVEHLKPRLLGHWGTTPGLNFIYAHLNRVIRMRDLDMIGVWGPGHGAPGLVANAYLEGTYGEVYPDVAKDIEGLRRLMRQFSFPGGIPSHASPELPGSIHEGGELGYSLAHAFGAVLDNPALIAACIVGDGEAETGPLAASWHSSKFLDPATDGAVLPILHLNGLQDRESDDPRPDAGDGTAQPPRRLRLRTDIRRGKRPGPHASGDGRSAGRRPRRHRGDPGFRPRRRDPAPALAGHRASQP